MSIEVEREEGFSDLPTDADRSEMIIVDWSLWSTLSMARTIQSLDNVLSDQRPAALNHLELMRHSIELPHHHHWLAHTDIAFGLTSEGSLQYTFTAPDVARPFELVLLGDRYLVSRFEQLGSDDGTEYGTIPLADVTVLSASDIDPGTVLKLPKSQINENSRLQLSEIESIVADYYALTAEDGRMRLHPIIELFLEMLTHWTADTEFYISSVKKIEPTDSNQNTNVLIEIFHNATPAGIKFAFNLDGLAQANSLMLSTLQ